MTDPACVAYPVIGAVFPSRSCTQKYFVVKNVKIHFLIEAYIKYILQELNHHPHIFLSILACCVIYNVDLSTSV